MCKEKEKDLRLVRQKMAFENAKDYLYFWYSKQERIENGHNLWLDKETSDKIWHEAFVEMSKF